MSSKKNWIGSLPSCTAWKEMEFPALGERIMTTVNRCDPCCSGPPHAIGHQECSSHFGQREEEESLLLPLFGPGVPLEGGKSCPRFQYQQVNECQVVQASWPQSCGMSFQASEICSPAGSWESWRIGGSWCGHGLGAP